MGRAAPGLLAARDQASVNLREHDRSCPVCNVRKRVRCAAGQALVRLCWAAEKACDDDRQRVVPDGQGALFGDAL